ncbi:MAG: hypothetical protein GF353_10725 [Candidatus Lokiarchaeota archaeon]|nr:hypothetical protein [Candidatus Lokiarchaeota archaeon]
MNNDVSISKDGVHKSNKYLIGPGLGLVIMGFAYILWWFAGPWAWEVISTDLRWVHNWAYAIIIFNVGLAWYQKSPLSRLIAMVQSFMLPITGSGSYNTLFLTLICGIILIIWVLVVLIERTRGKVFLEGKLSRRGFMWLNMHSLIIAWLLIAHMGLMFFIVRLPMEAELMAFSRNAGYLRYLPPESLEFATWVFDIGLFVFLGVVLWEQYKMGYNVKNEPWPRYSFYICILIMISSLIALLIQELTIGFDWVSNVYS